MELMDEGERFEISQGCSTRITSTCTGKELAAHRDQTVLAY